jgi:hypothetical protein
LPQTQPFEHLGLSYGHRTQAYLIGVNLEARVSIQGAYLYASREAAAGWRHDNAAVREWSMKISRREVRSTSSLDFTNHVGHVTLQYKCYGPVIVSLVLPWKWLKAEITRRTMHRKHVKQSTRNKGTSQPHQAVETNDCTAPHERSSSAQDVRARAHEHSYASRSDGRSAQSAHATTLL